MLIADKRQDPVVKSDLSVIYGLAFLPAGDVVDCWEDIKENILSRYPATEEFTCYFEDTWLYSRRDPIEMWSVYESTFANDPRTNNLSEGSNNAINTNSKTCYKLYDVQQSDLHYPE